MAAMRLLLILILILISCLAGTMPLFAAPLEIIPAALRGGLQPQVAVAPSGRVHVVFGKGRAIYHTSSPDGRTFSSPAKIGELEKLALGMRRGPRVTATEERLLVTAISHADGNLHAWTSPDIGKTWKESPALNTTLNSAREGLQALAGDGRGLVVAVWLDSRSGGMEPWFRLSRDGGATWASDASLYASPDGHICECCAPNVAISSTGEIAVMWRNWVGGSRDLYLATSRDGLEFSPARKLGTGSWKLDGCPMDGGGLAFAPGGDWIAVWRREKAIFASEPGIPEKPLASSATQPLVAYAGKTPLILWEANGSVMLRKGSDEPVVFARDAKAASIASGPAAAFIAWEAAVDGQKTLLFDCLP